uniref:Protein SHQ1 homolog n=1 Tax=Lygus hesperus TaxID=30085 RepID=A0A146KTI1_LYGHE
MLTPNFELKQTDRHVILEIKAPLANIARTELVADDFNVFFSSPPYYLRLKLPGQVRESMTESGTYDVDGGIFTFRLEKVIEGQDFEDLDLIGKFLFAHKKYQARPKIEVLDDVLPSSNSESEDEDEEQFWIAQQTVPAESPLTTPGYGFANKITGNGEALREEFYEIIELMDLEGTPVAERRLRREREELARFSDDHYLADFMEPSEINAIIEFKAPWEELLDNKLECKLTQDETEYLKDLGNRDYLLDAQAAKSALLSLADIVFAYAYNFRTFTGENTVESAWTINKLSATLSWFQTFETAAEVKVACVRRSLIYPLYRHYALSMKVLEDTVKILKLGRRQILKCLIDVHKLFNASEPRYLLNQLYITDYCIWLQKVSDHKIESLVKRLEEAPLAKVDVRLDLEELERAALMVLEEELEAVNAMLSNVSLKDDTSSELASSSGTSDEDSSSDSDETSGSTVDSDDT